MVVCGLGTATIWSGTSINDKRRMASRVSYTYFRDRAPRPLSVCGSSLEEYVGRYRGTPESLRRRLREIGFESLLSSYMHVIRERGVIKRERERGNLREIHEDGQWQIHVRLFSAPSDETHVFAHYEPTPGRGEIHTSGHHIDIETAHSSLTERLDIDEVSFTGTVDIRDSCQ